jgi:hypothetical protein
MIAPGLEAPTPSAISKQLFGPHLIYGTGYPPVLLFRAKHAYGEHALKVSTDNDQHRASICQRDAPFHYPYNGPSLHVAGLYLGPTSPSEDEVSLSLPFGIESTVMRE